MNQKLDALVAARVMGWKFVPSVTERVRFRDPQTGIERNISCAVLPGLCWSPSTDISAAFDARDHWLENRPNRSFVLQCQFGQHYQAECWDHALEGGKAGVGFARGTTDAQATCFALLRAVGVPDAEVLKAVES